MKMSSIVLVALFICISAQSAYADNELSIGNTAKSNAVIDIPIVPPADFNFKPKAEIFALRKQEVQKHGELLRGSYSPSDEVFGQVVDKRPWWGSVGEAYYGPGQNSIKGPSIQSRFILNPFLLVGIRSTPGLPKERIKESDLASKSYLTSFPASGLRWWPKAGKAEVTYQVSSLQSQFCSWLGTFSWTFNSELGLELINARDLGLQYVYIPPAWAYNIQLGAPMSGPIKIPQFIHCGGSCGYPGGCNNMSPATAALDKIIITKLPARIILIMWKDEPVTGHEPPDMTFTVNYK